MGDNDNDVEMDGYVTCNIDLNESSSRLSPPPAISPKRKLNPNRYPMKQQEDLNEDQGRGKEEINRMENLRK